ncbi:MAG TPA: amino acid adenylation domain-containing protein, partial [Thermoanaerobaculia bacterium]|nr:amino acid adenylation domain-containing protein [Thermoanaerobaculia bacterium]
MQTVHDFLSSLASKGVKLSAAAGQLNCVAPKGTLTADLKRDILKYKPELLALLAELQEKQEAQAVESPAQVPAEFPLSAGQQGLYILQKLHPELTAYNCPLCFKITGELNVELMARAWSYVLEQYPILTATVVEREGGLYQRLDERGRTTIQQHPDIFADDQQLLAFVQQRVKAPFDLNDGPLARIELFRQDGQRAVLLITVHHIVFDGTSAMTLLGSLLTFYQQLSEGRPVRPRHETAGYQAFVAWEEAMLASAEGASHGAYWQQQLSGELPVLELLPDLPRTATPSYDGRTLVEEFPEELCRWIRDYSKARSLPPSAIFLALFQLLLHKYSSQDEIIVGMPVTVRPAEKFAAEVGYFINMIPLRTRFGEPVRMKDFLRKVQGTMLDGIHHSSYPFPLILEKLSSRQVRKDPVFQVLYAYQNFMKEATTRFSAQETLQVETLAGVVQEADFNLSLEVFEHPTTFSVFLKYNPHVYTPDTVRRLFGHYTELLTALSRNPELFVHEYSMVPEPEKQQLLSGYNDTRADYPRDKCVHQLFVEQAAVHAADSAVACGDEQLTYEQLHRSSSDLALYLQALGVGPDSLVCLCTGRSLEMVVGLLGVVQAGGAYVPLDPDYPDERLAYMLRDSGAAIVLTTRKFAGRLSALVAPDTTLVSLDEDWASIAARAGELKAANVQLRQEVRPHHLAYVIYTSGSTGAPKGVMVEHRNLANLVEWHRTAFRLNAGDVSTGVAGVGFDAAVWEVWPPLCTGGTLVSPAAEVQHDPDALLRWWETLRADVSFLPTPLAESAFAQGISNAHLRVLLVGGDRLDQLPLQPERFLLVNNYGPTECTVVATSGVIERSAEVLHIGRPISNTKIYILDPHGQPVPAGVSGEMYVGGEGVARGYLNRPELTAERFLHDPFSDAPGERMYRTGDLARWLDDGNIQYLGRIDTQVKIRGFRIETGEIEAQLKQQPEVQDCAVIVQGEGANKQLIAFYRARGTTAELILELSIEDLRAHLARTLPDHMIPAAFVSLPAIPLNPNGKVDRRALAQMEVTVTSGRPYVAPRNDMEQQLVDIWAEVLNLAPEKIGVDDNFFELGGHSLLATQLISKIRGRLNADLPLKALFDGGSVADLAGLIDKAARNDTPAIQPVNNAKSGRLPLSFAQERLWFLNELEPDSAGYNVPGAVVLTGELNVDQLEQAFNLVIARHENLRTVFPTVDGQAYQQILDRVDFALERIDISHYEAQEARDTVARQLCHTEAITPFDLAKAPLIRGKVIRLAGHEHILMLNMHHIISDGWSLGVLIRELGVIMDALRNGRSPELPPLPIQYVDYSVWQRRWLEEGGILEQQLAYWKQKLSGVPEILELATDYPRPSVQSFAGSTYTFALDARLTAQLKRLAEQQGGTLYMVLLAAFKALLHRYTGQNDLCIGTPIANRQYEETEGLIGMFVNTLALRTRVDGDDPFVALLAQVKTTCLEAYEHQDAPFEKIVDLLRPQRNMAVSPLVQVMMFLQNADPVAQAPNIRLYPVDSGISKFDLTVGFTETADGLTGAIEYSTALYKPRTIERMAAHLTALCRAITAEPTATVGELDYLSAAEKHRVLFDYNTTSADYPKDRCLHELFVEQVALHPDKTAVVCGEEQLTYQQLYARSRELALYLQTLGVAPDSLVCLCTERSLDMVIGLLGIVQAGGAYVPLDPDYPDERLSYMLRDSGASIVLTESKLARRLAALVPEDTNIVVLDEDRPRIAELVAGLNARNVRLSRQVKPHHLAYVIYTSGSTGEPKGVMVEHRNLANLVEWHHTAFGLTERDVSTCVAGVGFDATVWEIWPPICVGATLVLPTADVQRDPEALLEWWETLPVDVSFLSTPLAELAFARGNGNAQLRVLLTGGDRLHQLPAESARFRLVVNNYGPTECTVVATSGEVRSSDPVLHIGRPISNTQIYILDPYRRPVAIGVAGEIYIGGAGVARGYLRRPELTAERFLHDPFSSEAGARMYRSGDLARWLEDGSIEYLGRIDTQVKIRGFRIELGEIEAQLNRHPQVQECAVIAQGEEASKQLIAFYRGQATTADHLVELPCEELRAHLSRTLPEYMVPAAFVSLPAIPLNPNGKVDRHALERMDVAVAARQDYVAPRDEAEQRLVAIWAEVLNREPGTIGVHDNFFEVGGHSLLATQLVSKIRGELEVDLPLKTLFGRGSVAELAAFIATARKSDVPPITPVERAQFERLPLSFAQERLWFINQLEPNSAGYNVPGAVTIQGELDIDQVNEAFNLLIERHESLRTVFPNDDGNPRQLILDRMEFELRRIDLSAFDKDVRDSEARRMCQTDAATPFDLAHGPLLRGMVIRLAEHEHILMLNMHHIISDGWSLGILIHELGVITDALRQDRRPELAPLAIQYADYSVWQRKWLEEGGILNQQLAYWQKKLAGVPESLDLATDYVRPSVQSFAGGIQTFALDAQLTAQLKRLAEQQGGTLYMVLLAAFKVLLHRYTGQTDICVGSPIANRQYGETERVIGMFVNLLALRSRVESAATFAALLAQVKETCVEAYEHQDAPFEKVVDLLQPQRNLTISPLFQVTLTLQNTDAVAFDASTQRYPLDSGISKFDLGFDFTETAEGLAGSLEYSAALYKPATVARMIEHFTAICRAITATPAAQIRDLQYMGDAEKHELLAGFNDTAAEFPRDKCLHQLFMEQVAQSPERIAVISGDEQLTYEQLYARSRDLALYLQAEGVQPDGPVGLCMERSLDMVVSLLGILQAGGAYVPLDPDYPVERLAHMLQDSSAAIVLTQEKLQDKLTSLTPEGTRIVPLDLHWPVIDARVAALKAENVELVERVEPHHLAYVIYTSGSTGRPKGVMNEHRGVVNRLIWMQNAYALDADDTVLQKTPFSFDVSVWEFFWPLLTGARLVMARPEGHKDPGYLVDTIREHRITTLHFVPPMLQVFLDHPDAAQCLSLTRVICSGEALPSILVRRFGELLPHATLYNLYGPTEAAVDVTAWTCPAVNVPTIIPIGRPIANTRMYILDAHGATVPIGIPGELYIGGVQVARGYLNRPELTAERFVTDPFAGEASARMYKTGDLARWQDDGTIEYLGRNDFQVKIRGFRIELGEIEARLAEHEGVREAVVVAREDTPGDKRLVAYYAPSLERAFPVAQLLRLQQTEAGATASHCTLANGLTVFQQNQTETDFVYDEIFKDDGYLRHGVTLADGDCVFDVGANIGLFSLFVAQRARNTTIYAFEPIPTVYESLRLNAALYGWAGRVYECGLADEPKEQVFTFYPHNTVISSSSTSQSEAREIVRSFLLQQQETGGDEGVEELLDARLESEEYTCQLRTISEIIEENGVERIDLLKVDVEKGEYDVLRGIRDEDWEKIRQLVVEVHDVSGRLAEITGMLRARGYEVSCEQSQSLQATDLYNLYAFHPGSVRSSVAATSGAAEKVWASPDFLLRDLRAFLSERLPDYMVPAAYVPLAEMPLSPNGKLDRKALPAPEAGSVAAHAYEAPAGEIEIALAQVWSEVLHVERIGRNDNFFELGGHSLLATQLVSKIRSRLDVDLPLKAVFERTSVARLAEFIATAQKSEIPPIRPVDRTELDRLPLSFAQERLWFLNELEPDSAGYNVPGAVTIRGELDVRQLEQAFNLIIARHENLRTVFPTEEGRAHQRILESVDFRLQRVDLSHVEAGPERAAEARRLCQAEAATPFDLAMGPLMRGMVLELAEQEHILMLNMHHIISDAWSVGVMIRELDVILEALRQGQTPELPPLPIQYVDYSVWQRKWLEEGGILERQLGYWQGKLAGVPQSLDLPADHPRPSVRSFAGAARGFALDAQLTGQLKRLAEQQGGTLYMVLLAAFKVLLHRYTGQNDICVGTPIANRQYGETDGLIGMFINTLALRSQVDAADSFAGLLTKVKTTCLEAYENQDAPFEKVVDLVCAQRNLAISPLFQVMVILQNTDMGGAVDDRIQLYPLDTDVSKFDLTAEFTETPEGLAGALRYSTALYEPETIDRLVGHFTSLCRAIAIAPGAEIGALEYISAPETHQLVSANNATQAEYPADKCLHQLFAEQVALHPDRPAVVFGDQQLTYQELYDKSRDVAAYLRSLGVGPDSLVGLFTERSLEMVVGLMGILQAGGAYVPLDPDYPAERLQYMLEDAAPAVVLTQERLKAGLPASPASVIALDSDWSAIAQHARTTPHESLDDVTSANLAYVIYTSGSTGVPKGVMIRHTGVVNLWNALENAVYESRSDWTRVSVNASFSFDSSVKQFVQLLSGRTLVLIPQDVRQDAGALLEFISHHQVDVLDCTPSQLVALTGAGMFGSTRHIPKGFLVGGEAIDAALWRSLVQRPEAVFYNVYGPTECTVDATVARIAAERPFPHIGRPVANTQIYILDSHRRLVPSGVCGELCVGGAGVARGYLNRPELTAERFIADPFGGDPHRRLYTTGDLGRWRPDGTIEYLGRNDQQVKLRGQRIELGEIEAQLARHAGVQEAVVITREDEPGEKRLVAYVTSTGAALGPEELRSHLLSRVPQYMVPAAFVELEALPLTPNGKVDRKALPRPEAEAYAHKEYEPPQGRIEESLALIWQQLLHIERVGRNDDFFELGGHSLLATQLISRIRTRFDVGLPLKALFEGGSVAQLAALIAKGAKNDIPPIRPVDRSELDRLPLSFAQERLWFLNELEPGSAAYNVPGAVTISGELDVSRLEQAFNLIIARHENLRTVFPSEEGQAHQQILDRVDFRLERIDLSHYAEDARDNEAMDLCRTDAATPFDLANGPLLRGKVIKLHEHEHILMLNMHHIISDGWSLGVFINELAVIV